MLGKRISEYNAEICEIEKEISCLKASLEEKWKIGDELKVEEVKRFMDENKLSMVWFLAGEYNTVYGGDYFDFDGLRKKFGTHYPTKESFIELLKQHFSFDEQTIAIPYDFDSKLITLYIFSLPKK